MYCLQKRSVGPDVPVRSSIHIETVMKTLIRRGHTLLPKSLLHAVQQLHLTHVALDPVDGLPVLEEDERWQRLLQQGTVSGS